MIIITIPNWVIPSQNVRDRRHWSANQRDKKRVQGCARAAMSLEDICGTERHRYVEIMCWRTRKITDDANYRGGAKSVLDALKLQGAIHDDADKFVTVTYLQDVRSKCPIKGREMTRIRVSAEPIVADAPLPTSKITCNLSTK